MMPEKERSCVFHWEQSMIKHTAKCIRSSFQEEHKILCRKWLHATSEQAAKVCKDELRHFWRAGHAVVEEIPALETWLSWWDIRVSHWGDRFVAQDETGAFVPRTNLSESKHASMRASIGYKSNIGLYEATCADMSLVVLQSVHYNAYLKGMQTNTGPIMADLAVRFMSSQSGQTSSKRLVDMTDSTIQEMQIPSPEMIRDSKREKSVQKPRSIFIDPEELLEEDSPRPQFVTITTPINGIGHKKLDTSIATDVWPEQKTS